MSSRIKSSSSQYDHLYKEVSEELGIPVEVVRLAYNSAWRFARMTIRDSGIYLGMPDEEFNSKKLVFHFPHLGRLRVSLDKMRKKERKVKWLKENIYKNDEDKEDKTDVHGPGDDDG